MSEKSVISVHSIVVQGAYANNLQNISVEIPRHQLTVVTGPSGSGKSSFVFDVLYAEAERRFGFTRDILQRRERTRVENISGLSFAVGIRPQRMRSSRARLITLADCFENLRTLFFTLGARHCLNCNAELPVWKLPAIVSELFKRADNSETDIISPALVTGDFTAARDELLKRGFSKVYVEGERMPLGDLETGTEIPLWLDRLRITEENKSRLAESIELALTVSSGRVRFTNPELECATQPYCAACRLAQRPIHPADFSFYRRDDDLPAPEVMALTLAGITFSELFSARVDRAYQWAKAAEDLIAARSPVLAEALRDVTRRLECLAELGLSYLEFSRPVVTLSTGEAYRVRLARQLAHRLQGVLYLLDEPSVGLSAGDVEKLQRLLRELVEQGNTLVSVEQHETVVKNADHLLEFGPGAGKRGGKILQAGSPKDLDFTPLTIERAHHKPRGELTFSGIKKLYLDIPQFKLPLGVLVGISGVSGSGKTTLVSDVLVPALRAKKLKREPSEFVSSVEGAEQIEQIFDATDLGLSGSDLSIAASALGIWARLREIFAQTVEAKRLGLTAASFSLRNKKALCAECGGRGEIRDRNDELGIPARCEKCGGSGLKADLLSVRYRNLSLADVLSLTIAEAVKVFLPLSDISQPLRTAERFGLDYLKLGERTSELSSGELQRIALSGALTRGKIAPRPGSIFFFDEPTAGLSREEVLKFMTICDELLAAGYSVVLIEHQPAILNAVDYLIEIGPGPGDRGGKIIRSMWQES